MVQYGSPHGLNEVRKKSFLVLLQFLKRDFQNKMLLRAIYKLHWSWKLQCECHYVVECWRLWIGVIFEVWHNMKSWRNPSSDNYKKFKLFFHFFNLIRFCYSHFCVKDQNVVNLLCKLHLLKLLITLKCKIKIKIITKKRRLSKPFKILHSDSRVKCNSRWCPSHTHMQGLKSYNYIVMTKEGLHEYYCFGSWHQGGLGVGGLWRGGGGGGAILHDIVSFVL
jgi:hypothetical protein